MTRSLCSTVLYLVATLVSVRAAAPPSCGPDNFCPSDTPCCGQYGQCGVGAYCLSGCDPRYSFNLDSCLAAPVCSDKTYDMSTLKNVMPNTAYLGDASTADWVSSGNPLIYNDATILTMPPDSVGTLLTSTNLVWYGKISATLTTSQGAGVVTAFIMMSDVHDEIDFEFVGVDLEHAQSNFYYQGITDYHNAANLTLSNGNSMQQHTYEFDWSPDELNWIIDGNVMRTLTKNSTYNETDMQYHYPQTPSHIMLSLWPAGLPSNGQGTIDWSGGEISWNSPYMHNGYYFAMFSDVSVQCYNPPAGYDNQGTKAYAYTNRVGVESSVAITDNNTEIASIYATGNQPHLGQTEGSNSAAANYSVPGLVGAGTASSGEAPTQEGGSSGNDPSSRVGVPGGSAYNGVGFDQGTQSSSDAARLVVGSLVALVAVFAAAMML